MPPADDPNQPAPPKDLAWRQFSLHAAIDGGALGLALGGVCQCKGTVAESCTSATICDDSAVTMFTALDKQNGAPIDKTLSAGIDAGGWTVILRLANYNDSKNDSHVTLRWYFSRGMAGGLKPKSDCTDTWNIAERSLVTDANGNLDMALYLDDTAYVANGMLVANFPAARLEALGVSSALVMKLSLPQLVAKLVQNADGKTWRLDDGMIEARLAEPDAFALIAAWRSDAGEAICRSHPAYSKLAQLACDGRDVRTEQGGPTAPCTALSVAIAFRAETSVAGKAVPKAATAPVCAAANDPASASCAKP